MGIVVYSLLGVMQGISSTVPHTVSFRDGNLLDGPLTIKPWALTTYPCSLYLVGLKVPL